jgi:hypothetical protein
MKFVKNYKTAELSEFPIENIRFLTSNLFYNMRPRIPAHICGTKESVLQKPPWGESPSYTRLGRCPSLI